MIWHLDDLVRKFAENAALVDGRWVPSRPLPAPLVVRLRAAWLVLAGRADAVLWEARDPEGSLERRSNRERYRLSKPRALPMWFTDQARGFRVGGPWATQPGADGSGEGRRPRPEQAGPQNPPVRRCSGTAP